MRLQLNIIVVMRRCFLGPKRGPILAEKSLPDPPRGFPPWVYCYPLPAFSGIFELLFLSELFYKEIVYRWGDYRGVSFFVFFREGCGERVSFIFVTGLTF